MLRADTADRLFENLDRGSSPSGQTAARRRKNSLTAKTLLEAFAEGQQEPAPGLQKNG
jgi:hypothetical protein